MPTGELKRKTKKRNMAIDHMTLPKRISDCRVESRASKHA